MDITICYRGGYLVISNGTEAGTMRYLYWTEVEALKLYREKFGLKGKRLTITRDY